MSRQDKLTTAKEILESFKEKISVIKIYSLPKIGDDERQSLDLKHNLM